MSQLEVQFPVLNKHDIENLLSRMGRPRPHRARTAQFGEGHHEATEI